MSTNKYGGKTGSKTTAITKIPPEDYQNILDAKNSLIAMDKWMGKYDKWYWKYGIEYAAPSPTNSTASFSVWIEWYKEYYKWLKKYKEGGNPPTPPPHIPPK